MILIFCRACLSLQSCPNLIPSQLFAATSSRMVTRATIAGKDKIQDARTTTGGKDWILYMLKLLEGQIHVLQLLLVQIHLVQLKFRIKTLLLFNLNDIRCKREASASPSSALSFHKEFRVEQIRYSIWDLLLQGLWPRRYLCPL